MESDTGSTSLIFTTLGGLRLVLDARVVKGLQREGEGELARAPTDVAAKLGVQAPPSPRVLALRADDEAPLLLGETVELRSGHTMKMQAPAIVEEHFSHLGLEGVAMVDGQIWFVLEGGSHVD